MIYNDIKFFDSNLHISKNYNTYTDYVGYQYIRILKTFVSEATPTWSGETYTKNGGSINSELIEKFPLRFYLPVDSMATKGLKTKKISKTNDYSKLSEIDDDPQIEHLVIMINGLDEHKEFFLKQYDFLGAAFAEQKIASVLLSTPFHLHRTIKLETEKTSENSKSKTKIIKPSHILLEDWKNLFNLYDTTYKDIKKIIRNIRECDNDDYTKGDMSFYKNNFKPNTKITLLGYSLGGLSAFGYFLHNCVEEDIDKLILFNTPGNLLEASSTAIRVDTEKWKKTMDTLSETSDRLMDLKSPERDTHYINFFLYLMIGNPDGSIKKIIDQQKNRMLQIICGGDSVIDLVPWSRYFDETINGLVHKKISQHIFSGVGHNPILEARGSELMPNISRIMTEHIFNDPSPAHWQEKEVEDEIMKIIHNTEIFNEMKENLNDASIDKTFTLDLLKRLLDELSDDTKRQNFLKLYYLSKIYYPKFYELVERNRFWRKK